MNDTCGNPIFSVSVEEKWFSTQPFDGFGRTSETCPNPNVTPKFIEIYLSISLNRERERVCVWEREIFGIKSETQSLPNNFHFVYVCMFIRKENTWHEYLCDRQEERHSQCVDHLSLHMLPLWLLMLRARNVLVGTRCLRTSWSLGQSGLCRCRAFRSFSAIKKFACVSQQRARHPHEL